MLATALALPTAAMMSQNVLAEDLAFTLKNSSNSPLVEFYVEASSQDDWGENLLGESVSPGEAGTVTIADGRSTCTYDILGVFADGSKLDERQLDLCELGSYTYK
ncbi:MAG: hypothetical protein KME42_04600 [Tildeniella nuda ZEHNDER 1965/U140]|jgi:hypothetical protein|nr:hypothetical protein [Tildeniella nuda ZEHNDER 1965/U140]